VRLWLWLLVSELFDRRDDEGKYHSLRKNDEQEKDQRTNLIVQQEFEMPAKCRIPPGIPLGFDPEIKQALWEVHDGVNPLRHISKAKPIEPGPKQEPVKHQ
jgi:hypothetical protein